MFKPHRSIPIKVMPKCCEYGCSILMGGRGASFRVWHESMASGLTSISEVESLDTLSGSIFRSRLAVESLFDVDCVTIGCVTARFELIVTGAISLRWILSRSESM